jgi:hypothetical protein
MTYPNLVIETQSNLTCIIFIFTWLLRFNLAQPS